MMASEMLGISCRAFTFLPKCLALSGHEAFGQLLGAALPRYAITPSVAIKIPKRKSETIQDNQDNLDD
jgi:hypothetical protein